MAAAAKQHYSIRRRVASEKNGQGGGGRGVISPFLGVYVGAILWMSAACVSRFSEGKN